MSKYKIKDIVLCRRKSNIIGNYFIGEIIHVEKINRNVGKGWYAEKNLVLWWIFDYITCYKFQPEKLYRYDIKYTDGYVEQNIPAELIKFK